MSKRLKAMIKLLKSVKTETFTNGCLQQRYLAKRDKCETGCPEGIRKSQYGKMSKDEDIQSILEGISRSPARGTRKKYDGKTDRN